MVFQDLWSPAAVELALNANAPPVHTALDEFRESSPKVGASRRFGRTFKLDGGRPATVLNKSYAVLRGGCWGATPRSRQTVGCKSRR